MKNSKIIKHVIYHQGAPIINTAFVNKQCRNILLMDVDMSSKYCEISATGEDNNVPEIIIDANSRSLYLHKKKTGGTFIKFPSLKGWNIFCCEASKYTARICFVKKSKNA